MAFTLYVRVYPLHRYEHSKELKEETRKISLTAINFEDQTYQVRDPRASTFTGKVENEKAFNNHVDGIVKALRDNPKIRIPHIEVIEEPSKHGKYVIIDGFHRYAAYKKINKQSKGARYKQLTIRVLSLEQANKRYFTVNSEHKGRPLTSDQLVERQWQQFLMLMRDEPSISKKQTVERIGIKISTVGKWRMEKLLFEEKGFFKHSSRVPKNKITGFPVLRLCRDELKEQSFNFHHDSNGLLSDRDKESLRSILRKALPSDDPELLLKFISHYWGNDPRHVDYDISIDELEKEYDAF